MSGGKHQITLTVFHFCAGCGKGYRARNMHEVEVKDIVHGETALLCEACYREYMRASQEPYIP